MLMLLLRFLLLICFVNTLVFNETFATASRGLFACGDCSKIFTAAFEWQEHQDWHETVLQEYREGKEYQDYCQQSKPYKCKWCSDSFFGEKSLQRHAQSNHSVEWQAEAALEAIAKGLESLCSRCGKPFAANEDLERHASKDHCDVYSKGKKVIQSDFSCQFPACTKTYSNQAKLTLHVQSHKVRRDPSSQTEHVCNVPGCTKTFSRRNGLTLHQQMHVRQNKEAVAVPVIIKTADQESASDFEVSEEDDGAEGQVEEAVEENQTSVIGCGQCPLIFKTTQDLAVHKKKKHTFTCGFIGCVEYFYDAKAWFAHVQQHNVGPVVVTTNSTLDFATGVAKERIAAAPLADDAETNTAEVDEVAHETFICETCDQQFLLKRSLTRHKALCFNKVLICGYPDCGQECTDQEALVLHAEEHKRTRITIQSLLQCNKCKRSFSSQHGLMIHKRSHNPDQPVCEQADKQVKRIGCDECDFLARNKHGLNIHKAQKHKKNVTPKAPGEEQATPMYPQIIYDDDGTTDEEVDVDGDDVVAAPAVSSVSGDNAVSSDSDASQEEGVAGSENEALIPAGVDLNGRPLAGINDLDSQILEHLFDGDN